MAANFMSKGKAKASSNVPRYGMFGEAFLVTIGRNRYLCAWVIQVRVIAHYNPKGLCALRGGRGKPLPTPWQPDTKT